MNTYSQTLGMFWASPPTHIKSSADTQPPSSGNQAPTSPRGRIPPYTCHHDCQGSSQHFRIPAERGGERKGIVPCLLGILLEVSHISTYISLAST